MTYGTIIRLSQLVKSTFEEEEAVSYFRINGLNSIYLSVTAKETANQLNLSKQVQTFVNKLREDFPAGYELHLSYDAGEYIQKEMNKIYFRSGLTVLILLCFVFLIYRNLKYSLLILVSLIVNLAVSVIFYHLFKLELHLYSLAGIMISLSLVIDNIIIMSDQIVRQGNRKAFMAIMAATLTTICSLIIVLLMDKTILVNLQDFTKVLIINLTVSLFVALFFVPAWIEKFKITKQQKKTKSTIRWKRELVRFNKFYEWFIYFSRKKKVWLIVIIILIFGGTLYLFVQKVRKTSYSVGEKTETSLSVTASLPNGSTKEQMNTLIRKMEDYIKPYPEIRQFVSTIENGQRANIRISFEQKFQSGSFPYLLKNKLIGKALELGGGSWSVYGLGDGFNNDVKENAGRYQIRIFGYNYEHLNVFANALKDSLLQYSRIKEVTIDSKFSWYKDDYMEFVFNPDKMRLAEENILPVQLFNSLNPLFEKNGYAGNWTTEDQTAIPVRLFSGQANEMDIWDLENYPEKTASKTFKLTGIASIEKSQVPKNIAKENQQYFLCLQYEYIGPNEQGRKVMERTIEIFNKTIPLGYKAESASNSGWHNNKMEQYWFLFLIIAVLFFTTGILFNSVRKPFIIIFIIPISFIGLFLAFYFFNVNFDQGGFAAFILLTGLSVNSNIYVLNEYNNLKKHRSRLNPVKIYLKAWNVKIRPVFLTILSTIVGFLPFIIGYKESFWYPLAVGTIGGLIVSLIGTFLFLPIFTTSRIF